VTGLLYILAVVSLVGAILALIVDFGIVSQLTAPPAPTRGIKPILRAIRQSLSSRNFAVMAGAGALHCLNLGIHAGLGIYFATYFWKLPAKSCSGWNCRCSRQSSLPSLSRRCRQSAGTRK
jgi:hypothetical protein